MPEVVYAKPDAEGNARTWDVVFPIWKNKEEDTEWRDIDRILESIAMNNRFGGKTPEELKQRLLDEGVESCRRYIEEDGLTDLEARSKTFMMYGRFVFYVHEVFENLGGAYREHKK